MKQKKNLIEWAMDHKAVPLSIAFVLVVFGFYALFNMPRNEFPEFTVRQGLVIGVYPGASSKQVEEQLTTKVEEYLFGFNEVDKTKTYSYSKDGMMYIFVEISSRVKDSDTKSFWNKLKNGVLILQATSLPKEVKGILVNSDFGSTSAILLSVESATRPYKDLQKHVEEIEDDLRRIENVAKINHSGNLSEQIGVYVDNNKLAHYGLSSGSIMQVLQNTGAISPAGTLDGQITDRPIHLSTFFNSESDLARQIIKNDNQGNVVRLRDVATIKKEYDDPDSYVTTNGTKSIIISLEMASGKNIVHFGHDVDERLDKIISALPSDIKVTKLANQPDVVNESISHFMKEFGFALIGVIVITILLLPFRIASVAAATIPITIASTLAIMYLAGIELNTVTLAALVIVLGIVVDDPIVVIDNHVEKLDHGLSVWDAARNSAKELFPSVFTATLAISATFAPLIFFMNGIAADFVGDFPITIIIALTISLLISMLLVPYFNTIFIKKGLHELENKSESKGPSMLDRLQKFFNNHIGNAITNWKLTVLFGVLAVGAGIFLMALLPQQLFPKVERNQFAMEIYLPQGYRLEQTDSVVRAMEKIMAKDKRVVNYTSFIGSGSPRFHSLYAPNLPEKNYAQILINTTTEKTTEEILKEYQQKYSDLFPSAYVRMKQLVMTDSQAPIEVRISGNNIAQLKEVGNEVAGIARKTDEVIWTRTDYQQPLEGIHVEIKQDEAARLGLSKSDIANTIAMNMEGLQATQVWEGKYGLNVKIKEQNSHKLSYADLRDLSVISRVTGAAIPLRQVADITPEWNEGQLVRRNGVRTLTVKVDIDKDAVAANVLAKISPSVDKLPLPEGLYIEYGGDKQMTDENMGPMGLSLLLSIILLTLILIWHFKSIKHALLSIITMPLSIFGAALGLHLLQYPFGFTSFIGLLALCGIVVRNGIILIDFADELRHQEKISVRQAAITAAERRMRPIFLTSSAAAVGVIPMIVSRSSLWGPLGTVICFGLMVSMLLTLFVLPVLYWLMFKKEDEYPEGSEPTTAQQRIDGVEL
ncbi:efflux RND transporter permease subunit [Pedobacter antarcticus]|uniref:efflux RND transporter permease subunit n=1 Tax=Pedobacter antarcticus TaxID=34086 RepID=UPI00094489D0|nr:efflux RND transporter permease subunit [Pedobacter antarcticus]